MTWTPNEIFVVCELAKCRQCFLAKSTGVPSYLSDSKGDTSWLPFLTRVTWACCHTDTPFSIDVSPQKDIASTDHCIAVRAGVVGEAWAAPLFLEKWPSNHALWRQYVSVCARYAAMIDVCFARAFLQCLHYRELHTSLLQGSNSFRVFTC